MIERGGGACLLLKPAHALFVFGEFSGQKLEGNLSSEPGVSRQIDLAHPARSKRVNNFVVTDVGSGIYCQTTRPPNLAEKAYHWSFSLFNRRAWGEYRRSNHRWTQMNT